jgi:hypothetical protein
MKEAKGAATNCRHQLQKVYPASPFRLGSASTGPTIRPAQNQHLIEGLRKAGVPEGTAKTN